MAYAIPLARLSLLSLCILDVDCRQQSLHIPYLHTSHLSRPLSVVGPRSRCKLGDDESQYEYLESTRFAGLGLSLLLIKIPDDRDADADIELEYKLSNNKNPDNDYEYDNAICIYNRI